jgi:hypothetical protein
MAERRVIALCHGSLGEVPTCWSCPGTASAPTPLCDRRRAGAGSAAGGNRPPPSAPGRREETAHVDRVAAYQDKTWCLAEIDIFCDLSAAEMDAIAAAATMKTYPPGSGQRRSPLARDPPHCLPENRSTRRWGPTDRAGPLGRQDPRRVQTDTCASTTSARRPVSHVLRDLPGAPYASPGQSDRSSFTIQEMLILTTLFPQPIRGWRATSDSCDGDAGQSPTPMRPPSRTRSKRPATFGTKRPWVQIPPPRPGTAGQRPDRQ